MTDDKLRKIQVGYLAAKLYCFIDQDPNEEEGAMRYHILHGNPRFLLNNHQEDDINPVDPGLFLFVAS